MWIIAVLLIGFDMASQAPVVLDRIAVAVGRAAVKVSDIDMELRVAAFLNRQPLDFKSQTRRTAAERLVDQQLIRDEMANSGYAVVATAEADAVMAGMRRDRFRNSGAQFEAELKRYGINAAQLRQKLHWQLTVLRFIDQRFRPGVQITDEDVQKFYDEHQAQLKRDYPRDNSLKTLEPKIRQALEGGQINQGFDDWLKQARQRTRIQYHEEAFHDQPG